MIRIGVQVSSEIKVNKPIETAWIHGAQTQMVNACWRRRSVQFDPKLIDEFGYVTHPLRADALS